MPLFFYYGMSTRSEMSDPDGQAEADKLVRLPRDIEKVAYHTASELKQMIPGMKQWKFEDNHDNLLQWQPAYQTADEFCNKSGMMGSMRVLFRTSQIKMFIPVYNHYYATRTVRLRGQATVKAIMRALQEFAHKAFAYYIINDLGQKPYEQTVGEMMQSLRISRLLCRRIGGSNQVYVEGLKP